MRLKSTALASFLQAACIASAQTYVPTGSPSVPLAQLAVVTNLTVASAGGYASADFWWPISYAIAAQSINTSTQVVGDVTMLRAAVPYVQNRRLEARVDQRPLQHELVVPSVTWSILSGTVATLTNDVLEADGSDGIVLVQADAGDRGIRRAAIPCAPARGGDTLANPFGEISGTWRHAVSTNTLERFAGADTNAISPYQYCRNSSHGPQTTNWFPNAYQLYGLAGTNDNAVLPTVANASFFWPELANALNCVTAWRGDWYAHAPYVIVSPHYAVGANHFSKSYTQTYWCFDRSTNDFRYVSWDPTAPTNGKIGSVRDVSIHRFAAAMPSNMIARVVRGSVLATVSPSVLDRSVAIGHTSHNTVALFGISPAYLNSRDPIPATHRAWTYSFGASKQPGRSGWVAEIEAEIPAGAQHTTHLWDSGHPLFWWLNGSLVLAGSWTTALGGPNAFAADGLLDQLEAMIRQDSGGVEGLWFMTAEELQ
jgi:hypothetical protein